MTTARHAAPRSGARHTRRLAKKRLLREELVAVAVLVVAFLVTVVLLGLQWLQGGQNTSAAGIHLLHYAPYLQHHFYRHFYRHFGGSTI